jgi:PAS domain S-box-containing protein
MRWFELFAGPLHLGSRHLVIVSHSNITSRRLQQDEVAASRMNASELAALVASSTDAIMSYDLDGRVLTWNRAASDLYGYTPDEAIGQSMEIIYPDDWPVRITEYRDRIISGEMTRFEVVRKTKSGALRDIAISASPVRDDSGAVVAIANFHRDITEQKATEERLRFITHELRHRTKNMLAIIGAIERKRPGGTRRSRAFTRISRPASMHSPRRTIFWCPRPGAPCRWKSSAVRR